MKDYMLGCDIVCISSFAEKIKRTPALVDTIFTTQEIVDASGSIASLAGKFAAKEAVCKALEISVGQWHTIIVQKAVSGKPSLVVLQEGFQERNIEVSISHDGDYVIAVVLALPF